MKSKNGLISALIIFALIVVLPVQGQKGKKGVNWPAFRGANAEGIADSHPTAVSWNAETGENIKWKAEIPGLGHSSPIVWGNRIFVTTAISGLEDPELKVGLYGSINPVEDETEHEFKLICLDKKTGKILWQKTSRKGVPEVKRHPKGTHANSTPVTNGKYVLAFFGSDGLYCYNMKGKLIWEKDFGHLDSSFFRVPTAQWGFASSPIIHENRVIVQCDVMKDSFIASLDLKTGKEIWRTSRDEYPTWSTPTIYSGKDKTQIIVNGFKHIGGYDFKTGEEIWKISGAGDIPVPTPVIHGDLVFINSAHGRLSPIFAIKLDAKGDISLKEKETASAGIVWSIPRGGAYMQTPVLYKGYLYNLRGNGSLTCFEAKTGKQIYREQVGKMASFSASGVAADGKLYFPSEQGNVYVVQAGPEFKQMAENPMKDILMASPAVSEGVLLFRSHHYLFAVADK